MQRRCIWIPLLNLTRWLAVCSQSCSFTNNSCSHTRVRMVTHNHNLHLCLISYHISKHYTASLPLAIHFMLTQHQSAGLPSHSTHPSLGCLSQSPSGKTNDVYIYPASPLRSPPPRSACEIPAHWKQSGSLMLHTGAVVFCLWSAVWNLQGEWEQQTYCTNGKHTGQEYCCILVIY